jgi:hypothetical protein
MKNIILNQRLSIFVLLSVLTLQAWCQVNVLTHHNDNRRSGANLQETQLNVACALHCCFVTSYPEK